MEVLFVVDGYIVLFLLSIVASHEKHIIITREPPPSTAPGDDDPLGVPSSSRPRPLTQRHRCFCSVAVNCQPLNFERAFADAFLFALSTQMGWEKG